MRFRIRKGLDIPINGAPEDRIERGADVASVAVLGNEIHGLQPKLAVDEGDRVRLGQVLFTDRRNPDIRFTAPGAGRIGAIHRGARRSLLSVVIELDGNEAESFASYDDRALQDVDAAAVRDNLVASGLWCALRTRPFSQVPPPGSEPAALFVTACDTNPLAADPATIIAQAPDDFDAGLTLLARLTAGPVYVCTRAGSRVRCPEGGSFRHAEFAGPHPAGLVGTHIHLLEPVSDRKTVWHIGYQDVMAAGELFRSGRLPTRRYVALGGPAVREPRILETRAGANLAELVAGKAAPGRIRIISGSVLSGHRAAGPLAWLGRYDNQVGVLREGGSRPVRGGQRANRFSITRAFAANLLHRGGFDLTTSQHGRPRALVPIGAFERVMPLDILATPLLKALLVEDTDRAKALGCLELDEEDLALCSFVCNGKHEYGPLLRRNLTEIEAHG